MIFCTRVEDCNKYTWLSIASVGERENTFSGGAAGGREEAQKKPIQ